MQSSHAAKLRDKVAIVTAATAGIGLGIAIRLGQEGAKVVISSRRKANVDKALTQLKQQGITCCGCVCHVGSQQHLQQLVQLALETYGKIDILISNAAVNPASGPILETPEFAIDKILEINVRSPIMLTREGRPASPTRELHCLYLQATQPLIPRHQFQCMPSARQHSWA